MKRKNIIFILLLFLVITIYAPKVNAEMIKIYDEEITEISEELEGKIFKYGTPINVGGFAYKIEYRNINYLTEFINTSYNSSTPKYIGYNTENIKIDDYSMYWVVDHANQTGSFFEITLYPAQTNYNICNIDSMSIGDNCDFGMLAETMYWGNIIYIDKNGQDLGMAEYNPFDSKFPYIGYTDNESLKDESEVWKLVEKNIYGGSAIRAVFEPTDEKMEDPPEFTLTCDKNTINYKDKTICHLKAKNYLITGDVISIALNEKDDLELLRLIPSQYFSVENNNNIIKINPKYISTEKGNFELLSFEVQARYETNEIDNISISNISYYNGETYTNLKTTINIENNNFLSSNPLTANPTLFKVLLVSAFLIACTTLLLKRESV